MTQRENRFRFCFPPGYKWCGPGCSGPGAPINDVDACCKAHDECYRKYGRSYRCKCDHEFTDCLHSKIDRSSKKGRDAAFLYKYMKFHQLFSCSFCKGCRHYEKQNGERRSWI